MRSRHTTCTTLYAVLAHYSGIIAVSVYHYSRLCIISLTQTVRGWTEGDFSVAASFCKLSLSSAIATNKTRVIFVLSIQLFLFLLCYNAILLTFIWKCLPECRSEYHLPMWNEKSRDRIWTSNITDRSIINCLMREAPARLNWDKDG